MLILYNTFFYLSFKLQLFVIDKAIVKSDFSINQMMIVHEIVVS